jgi:thioredoxin reductase (NADPH)
MRPKISSKNGFQESDMFKSDVLIVGAGPVGLFQVFELGLLGLSAHVVDSMPQVGGQCIELYPDKPIYDIPAIPVCSSKELIERLMQQIKPFNPTFHLDDQVERIERLAGGRFAVTTCHGASFDVGAIVVAAGLGAFNPRRLAVPGAAEAEGDLLHYKIADIARFAGRDIVIAGGGDSALDWALSLYDKVGSLVLIHRSAEFRASPSKVRAMEALCADGKMQFLQGDIAAMNRTQPSSLSVSVRTSAGMTTRVECNELLVFWGLHPKLGPIADWGLVLDKNQIVVDTARFATNVPGIFAVGDINTYAGKKKLILSGFHEAALAAFAVREHLQPGEKVHLQYTTTSPIMHKRLGVAA